MTGRRGSALVVVGWLRIDCGQQTRTGRWLRYPAADYRCGRCGTYECASGDQVPAFVTTIRAAHAAACPTVQHDREKDR